MKKDAYLPFLKELNITPHTEEKLSLNLQRVVKGDENIQRTPFLQDMDANAILAMFDEWFENHERDLTEELMKLEQMNRSKFGPRSIAKPWVDRKSSVHDYFKSSDHPDFPEAEFVLPAAGDRRYRPIALDTAAGLLKTSTNSGLPFYTRKGEVRDETLHNFDALLQRQDPCVLFTRTQEAGKTRNVWGFPIADTLNEMRFYKVVLDYQKQMPWRAAIRTPEAVDTAITNLINTSQQHGVSLVSLDFSSYDVSVKRSLQDASFHYIKGLFQTDVHHEIDYVAERFNTIGLITPDGVVSGSHGVPSGSTFTNEVDSLAQWSIASSENCEVNLNTIQIQGDDQASSTSDPEMLFSSYEHYGLSVNREKSYVSEDSNYVVYLQNLYQEDYRNTDGTIRGIYPLYRALGRLVFMERYDDFSEYNLEGRDYFAIRALSIIENCRNHPMFEEFVKLIAKHDKYGLKATGMGISEYARMLKDKAGNQEIMKYRYGDEISGIRGFKTFQILSEIEI